jgi:hypothetical protein
MFLKKLLLVSVAIAALIPSAWADDSEATYFTPDLTNEYTFDQVKGGGVKFSLVNDAGKLLYVTTGNPGKLTGNIDDLIGWGQYASVALEVSKGSSDENYLLPLFNINQTAQITGSWSQDWCLQTNGNIIFGYGRLFANGHSYGADGDNLGLWTFESVATGGYKIKNVGKQGYLVDGGAATATEANAAVWHLRPLLEKSLAYSVGDHPFIYALRNSSMSGNTGTYGEPHVYEYYQGSSVATGDVMVQNVSNLKIGKYKVTVCANASSAYNKSTNSGTGKTQVFVGDATSDVDVVVRNDLSSLDTYTFENVVVKEDGKLSFGIRNIAESGNWYVMKLSDIEYTESAASTIKEMISSYITDAKAISGNMYSGTKQSLDDAIAAAEKLDSNSSDEDVETTFDNLVTATSAAKASVAEYEEMAKYTYLTSVQEKANKLDGAGKTAFSSSSTEIKSNVTDGKYENTAAYEAAIDEAYVKAVKSQTTEGSDWTGVLSNPHFTTSDVSAWTITGSSPKVDVTNHNCEYYQQTFDMSQTLTGMKKGTYEISLQAFQRPGDAETAYNNYIAGNEKSYATLYTTGQQTDVKDISVHAGTSSVNGDDSKVTVNGTTYYLPNSMAGAKTWFEKTDEKGVPYYTTTVEAVVAKDGGDLTFGFKGELPSDKGWLIFDNFTLTYKSTEAKVDEKESETLLGTVPETDLYDGAIKKVVDEWKDKLKADKTDAEAYTELQAAIKKAEASIAVYKPVAAKLAAMEEVIASTNFYSAEALANNYTNPKAAYEARTMTTEEATEYVKAGRGGTEAKLLMSLWDEEPKEGAVYYINTWSSEGSEDGTNFTTPFYEYYTETKIDNVIKLAAKTLTGTLKGVTPGTYCVKVWSRVHVNAENATPSGVTLKVNGSDAVDVCKATQVGTSQFYLDYFKVKAVVGDSGELTIQFDVAGDNNINWLSFKNITYDAIADASGVTNLKEGIDNMEKEYNNTVLKNLGFEKGEYAPYANLSGYNKLLEIKATVNHDVVGEKEYKEAQNIYNDIKWTANEAEVNAIYDGTFAEATLDKAPIGWTMTEGKALGDGSNSRVFSKVTLSEFGEDNRAFLTKFDGQYDAVSNDGTGKKVEYYYGKTDGYTMPLKANTVYYVKARFKGWGSTNVKLNLSVSGPEGYTSVGATAECANNADASDDVTEPVTIFVPFKTGAAGDYSITLKSAKDANSIIVSRDYELKKLAVEETREIPTGNFGTICLPYPFTATGATVYAVEKVEDNVVKLTETEEIVAGKPYIFKATADAQTFAIADGDVTSEPSSDDYLTGVFVDTKATVGTYVLQTQAEKGQKFYSVTSDDVAPTIGAYHAYLTVPSTESALRISFGDETTTEVEAIKALTEGKAEIYDLNGRKQNTLRKGVNIVNGVKVIVK